MDPDWLDSLEGFDWDDGNAGKNWPKHRVSDLEAEEVFEHDPLLVASDPSHSSVEPRWIVLGVSRADRLLCVCFTVRGKLVRVISARDMNRREAWWYARA